jgi:hypothetical protein
MPEEHGNDELNVDLEKRETLRRMIASAAFAAPIVASFPISGMMIDRALAQQLCDHVRITDRIEPVFGPHGSIQGSRRVPVQETIQLPC